MSKVKTLQMAIEYINQLQGVLSLQSPAMQQQQHINHVSIYYTDTQIAQIKCTLIIVLPLLGYFSYFKV